MDRFIARFLCCLLSLSLTLGLTWLTPAQAATPYAALVTIKGPIGPATQAYVERSLRKAAESSASVVVLMLDTPGGLSQSMRGIVQAIVASKVPVIAYVAPGGARAASAGTYLLYASHLAAMAPATNLGAATPVNLINRKPSQSDGAKSAAAAAPSSAQRKATNDARAYLHSLAQLRQRNSQWAQQAVTAAATLTAQQALEQGVINFLAPDVPQLLAQANSTSVTIAGNKQRLATRDLPIKTLSLNWRDRFLSIITNPSIAYVLLLVGFYGLLYEFANPGMILPGVLGGIALFVALYALHLLPIDYAGLGLVALGLVFILAEAFFTSYGVLAIGGAVCLLIGSIMLFDQQAIGFELPYQLVLTMTVLAVFLTLFTLKMALAARRKPVVSGRRALLGQQTTVSIEQGHAWVTINGERWQVKSDKALDHHQQVRIAAVEGLVLIVVPITKEVD